MAQAKLFLPLRDGSDILLFAYCERARERRHEFIAVMRGTDPETLSPTGALPLSAAERTSCDAVATVFQALEARMTAASPLDAGLTRGLTDAFGEDSLFGGSPVLTVALYLDLHRQIARTEAALADYAARQPNERLSPGLTASVYEAALKFDRIGDGLALLSADAPRFPRAGRAGAEWAHLCSLAAALHARAGDDAAAAGMLREALAIAPGREYHLRLGRHLSRLDHAAEAIASYEGADALAPLDGEDARRLAWLHVAQGNPGQAALWRDRAEARLGRELVPLRAAVNAMS